jgi:ATP-dependent DNA ligase
MELPVNPPVEPMLATSVKDIPTAEGTFFEPKWDGFRCIAFRDGDEVILGSRGGKPLDRYFPEVRDAIRAELPDRCVVDGELVVARGDRLDFDTLSQRIHPAASRVKLLAEQTPAQFVVFDVLALGDESLMHTPYATRRTRLEEALAGAGTSVHVTPVTTDVEEARSWFSQFEGAGLDGLIAKDGASTYQPGKRVMRKIKHARTADAVVAGFRYHKSGPVVGSLLLGLYNADGQLQHVGVTSSFTAARRRELLDELAPYRMESIEGHPWAGWAAQDGTETDRMPGAPSRWSGTKDLSWLPLRPELVVEVGYDHMEGDRFRHTTQFKRWRPDRDPASCSYAQLEEPVSYDLHQVLKGKP